MCTPESESQYRSEARDANKDDDTTPVPEHWFRHDRAHVNNNDNLSCKVGGAASARYGIAMMSSWKDSLHTLNSLVVIS